MFIGQAREPLKYRLPNSLHSDRQVFFSFGGANFHDTVCLASLRYILYIENAKNLGVLQHPQAPTCLQPCFTREYVGPLFAMCFGDYDKNFT